MKYLKSTVLLFIGILFFLALPKPGVSLVHAQVIATQTTSQTTSGLQSQISSLAKSIASLQNQISLYLRSLVQGGGGNQRAQVAGSSLISNLSPPSLATVALGVGVHPYVDRTYTITSSPTNLAGDTLIQTRNDNKLNTGSNIISFAVNQASTVFVAFDTRISTHPSWLSAFTNTGKKIVTNDSIFELYSKVYANGGGVTLGGNATSPSNANSGDSNYFVVVTSGTITPSASTGTAPTSSTSSYPNGAPYPQSPVITNVTWNYNSKQQLAHGSDMWPVTWSNDGNLYSIWGDGGGFGGSNSAGRVSTGIARIAGTPPSITAVNINGGVNSQNTPTWACTSCAKSDAILSIGGTLYAWIGFQGGSPETHKLMWSTNYGKTWDYSSWSMPMSNYPVVRYGSFLNFGKDYQGARDNYVYIYSSPPNNNTDLWLIRVPKNRLLTPSAYQVFTGTDTLGAPSWSTNTSEAKAIFTDPKGVSWQQESYDPYLHRYLLTTVHGGNTLSGGDFGYGDWGMFDAPNPWGPWTTVTYMTHWQNTYPKFSFKMPPKWMSTNGKDFIMVYSGTGPYDSWNTISGTFTVNTSGTTPTPAPVTSITASHTSIASGGSTTFSWSSTNATACTASGAWSGTKSTHGSQTISNLTSSKTYTLTCTGSGGSKSASVSVFVTAPASTPTSASAQNALSSLQPGHWYKVPNSHLQDVSPTPFDSRVHSVIDAWSGGAFDTKRDNLIIWGGGHGDYWGNEIYTFNVNTLKWKRVNNPYFPAKNFPWGTTATILPDGSPGSRHTYDGLVYLPNQDRLWESGGSVWRSGNGVHDTEEFNFNTLKWTHEAGAPHAADGVATGYDPVTGRVFMVWCGWLTEYNPVANTWTTRGQDSCYGESVGAIDPVHRKFVVLTAGHAFVYTLTSSGSISRQNLNATGAGASIMKNADAPGLVYDPAIKKIVGWAGGTTVYALSFSTSQPTWQTISSASGNTVSPTPPTNSGTYSRWQYVPSKNVFILVNGTNQDVYFYKLSAGSGTVSTPPPSTTFATGNRVKTTATINVRSTANGTVIGTIGAGTKGTVIGGPMVAGNYTWWRVRYDNGTSGWSAEQYLTRYTAPTPAPVTSITASHTSIASGGSTTFSWSSTNATACTASGAWSGTKSTHGSQTISNLQSSSTYTITCTGSGGSKSASVSVFVTAPTQTPTQTSSTMPTSIANIPVGKWIAVKTPERYKGVNYGGNTYYGMKHVSIATDPLNRRFYFEGGDYMGGRGFKQSYQQETWSLNLAERLADPTNRNAGWRLEYPYCGPAGQIQPKHPDTVGWVWDSKRSLFWIVPGVSVKSPDLCTGETYTGNNDPATSNHGGFTFSHLMTFSPITKKWTNRSSNTQGPHGNNWKSVYDSKTDTIVRFGLRGGAIAQVYNISTNTWADYSLGAGPGGSTIYISNSFMAADIAGRAIYVIDPFHGRLFRYNMDSHTITYLGMVPGGARGSSGFYETYLAWDSVNHVLYWFDHIGSARNLFYVYHPSTKQWKSISTQTNISGINAVGRDVVFDARDNVLVLMGGVEPAPPPYFYIYRYGNGSGTSYTPVPTPTPTSTPAPTPAQATTTTTTNTPTQNTTPTSSTLISNLSSHFKEGTVINGGKLYTDRLYAFISTPASISSGLLIRTPNNDKFVTGADYLTFTLNKNATVFVAFDRSITTKPEWLDVFADTGTAVATNNGPYELYQKNLTQGSVINLGGNGMPPSSAGGSSSNYFAVIVQRATSSGQGTTNTSAPTQTPAPTLTLSTSHTSITSGGSTTLSWSSTNATACTASGAWSGSKSTHGSQTISNLQTAGAYTLNCSGTGGNVSRSVSISVSATTPSNNPATNSEGNTTATSTSGSGTSASAPSQTSTQAHSSGGNVTSSGGGGGGGGGYIPASGGGGGMFISPTNEENHNRPTTGQSPGGQPSSATQPAEHPQQTYLATLAKSMRGKFIIGATSNNVKTLQTLLASNKAIYPEARETGYYGPLTIRAVERFQRKYGIVSRGTPRTTGYGFVGPRTRAKIQEVFGNQEAQSQQQQAQAQTTNQTSTTPTATTETPHVNTYLATLAKSIRGKFIIGATSNNVKTLQTLLASNKAIYPEARETGYYGPLTIRAVQRFQRKYGIVSRGTPRTTGYGFVGPRTRAKIQEVFGGSSTVPAIANTNTATGTATHQTMTAQERTARIAQIQKEINSLLKLVQQLTLQLKIQISG